MAWKDPVEKPRISCPFGKKGKTWRAGFHTGIDYACPVGTEVYAVADGKVIQTNYGAAYGIHLVVQAGVHRFIYAHLSKLNLKELKDGIVRQGDLIGWSGATGHVFGAHLHLEARKAPYRYGIDAVDPKKCVQGDKHEKPA